MQKYVGYFLFMHPVQCHYFISGKTVAESGEGTVPPCSLPLLDDGPVCDSFTLNSQRNSSHTQMIDANLRGFRRHDVRRTRAAADVYLESCRRRSARWLNSLSANWHVGESERQIKVCLRNIHIGS